MIRSKTNDTIKHCNLLMYNFPYHLTLKKSGQIKKSMIFPKLLTTYRIVIFMFIGLMNIPSTAFAGVFSGDYNPYMGLSPFEQCMIYLGGDENIEEELNEDLYGCGEKWGINESP